MKNSVALFSGLALASLFIATTPVFGGSITTPYIAGDWQGWDATTDPMIETSSGSGIWTLSFTGLAPNSRHEFKVAEYNWAADIPGPNSWLYADGSGNITITYDGNSYSDGWSPATDRIGLDVDPGTWNAVGDWQSQVAGSDWDNANAGTVMNAMGGGMYEFSATLAPGSYNWKAVVNGTWDSISLDARSVGTANWAFNIDASNPTAIFRVNALTGVAQMEVVPEPGTLALGGLGLAALLIMRRRNA